MHALALSLLVAAGPQPKLPLTSLVLYENGLGYYERRGPLSAGQVVDLPLEPGQLDDALKSMVMLSQAHVASVAFAPPLAAEAARSLAGLPEAQEQRSLEALLRSLKGVEVEAQRLESPSVRGRVVEVTDDETRDAKGNPVPAPALLVFGEGGLSRLPLTELAGVRPLDGSVRLAWSRAAGSAARMPERQVLQVRTGRTGGLVALGYTTEAPVWRTTYRLVLSKAAARLQGFALVHNDSDEAWNGVGVTLASGRPASFVFPLAGPRYGRRELLAPDDGLETSPQLASEETQEHLRGPLTGESFGVGGIGTRGYGAGGGGYGSGSGSLGGRSSISGATVGESTLLEDGPSPLEPAAVSEAGDLFLYTVKEKVVLGARQSALLPIIDSPTKAEPVTVVGPDGAARLAVRLSNEGALTLEGGTVSVFTEGAYAGEAQLDRVKPGEVRVVRHGEDLDLEVSRTSRRDAGPVKLVRRVPASATVELHRVDTLTHDVELTSRSAKARTVLVELSERRFVVTQGATEDVRSPGQPRFARLSLTPREVKTFAVKEQGAVVEKVALSQLDTRRLDALLAQGPSGEAKVALGQLREQVAKREALSRKAQELEAKVLELERDVGRVRDNLAAAGKGGAAQVAETLGQRLLTLESALDGVRTERVRLTREAQEAEAALLASR